jgi:tetratricopeptide (TPR) repeat protein
MSEFELWNELGNIYYKSGAYIQAIHTCQKMIEIDPGCGMPYCNLASIYYCQGHYSEAVPLFVKGIELMDGASNKALLWKQLGDTYRKLEDFGNASTSYLKAAELDPENPTFQENLAEVESASRIFESEPSDEPKQNNLSTPEPESVAVSPSEIEVLAHSSSENACWVFEDGGSHSQADKATSYTSEERPLLLGSRILSDRTDEEDALESPDPRTEVITADHTNSDIPGESSSLEGEGKNAQDIPERTPADDQSEADECDDPGAHGLLHLGIMHFRKGEYERAFRFLKIALESAGRTHDLFLEALCHYAMARVETDLGKIEDAIRSYQSAANLSPEQIFPWNDLGNLNCMIDHYEDALVAFQEAIEHDPKDPVSWNGLGDVYHKLGQVEDAIAAYQLGNVFEKRDNNDDILKEFEKAVDPDQENPQLWNQAGRIYYDTGAFKEAAESYRKALELDPANINFQTSLAKAEQALERTTAGNKATNKPTLNEIKPETLPRPEALPFSTEFEEKDDELTLSGDLSCNQFVQEAEELGEEPTSPKETDGASEPEPTYWMFNTSRQTGKTQQSERFNPPRIDETMVGTIEPLPVYALKMHHEQSFTANQTPQESSDDRASTLVQLTPHTRKPSRTEDHTEISDDKQDRENTSTRDDLDLPKSSSSPARIRSEAPGPLSHETGIQFTSQLLPDLQIHESDIAAYRRVTEINPNNDRAWDALGSAYDSAGLHNEAIAAFEQAIALYPQRETYHYHLGIALAYLKKYEKAVQALEKVIALNPNYILAHCALAGYYRRLGKEAEAQDHARIARPSMTGENEYNQACFESISGDAERAIALLEIALKKRQIPITMVRTDPDLDFIRKDPRFEALINN